MISIVCLNLPMSIRYKQENMFLAGVIPGPKEPQLTLKYYLSPLVDEFWDPGIHFSQTSKFPEGQHLSALILVVCDLLGTRKTIGYAACPHKRFCNLCCCTQTSHGYGNTDCDAWEMRTSEEWCRAAERYQACGSQGNRLDQFNKTGIRWSELLCLPYIAPCVIVDPMHNLFLGLVKEHFMGILGINPSKPQEKPTLEVNLGPLTSTLNANDVKGIERLKYWLKMPVASSFPNRDSALKKLQRANLPALEFVCS